MINLSKKLYISLFTLLLLFVVAGTATFAWFKLNTNSWFDDMQLEVNSSDGVKISIDGETWKNELSKREISVAALAKKYGYSVVYKDKVPQYMDSEGNIISSDNWQSEFEQIKFQAVTTIDGINFKNLYNRNMTASKGDYVSLDLFFKADTEAPTTVYFSNKELADLGIPKTTITVKDVENITFPDKLVGDFSTFNPTTGALFTYSNETKEKPNFEFRTLASDALRFAVRSYDGISQNGDVRFYEVGAGVGSYATDFTEDDYVGPIGARYDATKNAAFTYYNNVRGKETEEYITPLSFDYVDSVMPKTYKAFDTVEGATVVKLDAANEYGAHGKAKINLTMWLEGWDADCIDTIWDQTVVASFAFTAFKQNYDPVKLTYQVTNPETGEPIEAKSWTVRQIQGEVISEQMPVKSPVPGYKFSGWGIKKSDGSIVPYEFKDEVWANQEYGTEWTLVTMWV